MILIRAVCLRIGIVLAALVASVGASAQDDPALAYREAEPRVVILRGLDKVTAVTRDMIAPMHQETAFGSLTVVPRYCRKRPPEETPETFVLVEIFERQTDGRGAETERKLIFSGWMFASNPALNPLEHPVFDVWPLDCVPASAARVAAPEGS